MLAPSYQGGREAGRSEGAGLANSLWCRSAELSGKARRGLRAKREGGQGSPTQPFTATTCRGVDKVCRLGLVMRDGQRRVPPRHRHRLRRLGVPQRLAC